MRTRGWLPLLVLLVLAVPLPAVVNHVFLLDCSGSMSATYAAGLSGQVLTPLLRLPGLFQPDSTVVVRCFDKVGRTSFRAHDPQRRYAGPYSEAAVAAAWPDAAAAQGRFTSLPEGLQLGVQDLRHLPGLRNGSTFLWLLTDNIEDLHGHGNDSDDPFYLDLYRTPIFHHIDFFPFSFHGHPLVLYLIQANQAPPLAWGAVESEIGKSLQAPPILFRPMQTGMLGVDAASVEWQGENGAEVPLTPVGGGYQLPSAAEGQPLRGRILFRVRSFSRDWTIRGARLSRATLRWSDSPPLAPVASQSLAVAPRRLAVHSQGSTAVEYAVDLDGGDQPLIPRRGSFWSGWSQHRALLNGTLRFSAEAPDLRLQIAHNPALTARIRSIHGLERIEQFMLPPSLSPAERQIHVALALSAPVRLSRLPLLAASLLGALLLAVLIVFAVLLRRPIPLDMVAGTERHFLLLRRWRRLPFPALGADHDPGALWFRAGFSAVSLNATGPWQIQDRNGSLCQRLFLRPEADDFTLVHSENGFHLPCSLEAPHRDDLSPATDPFSPAL